MNQANLFDGRALRDDGISRAIQHADAVVPTWSETAFGWFCLYAKHHREFITEAARQYAEQRGFSTPPDKRAWGAVAVRAARAGIVRANGYAKATDPKVHANPKTLWRITE